MIALLDYGSGNIRSVHNGLRHEGAEVTLVSTAAQLADADAMVLPGVGAFGDCARGLQERGLWDPVQEWLGSGKPFLGICVGYQLLFEGSEESPGVPGLGFFKGQVRKFPASALKVPQIGWNEIELTEPSAPLWRGLPAQPYVYFVHSYYPVPEDRSIVTSWCSYGETFAASAARDHVAAVQFHPEKSQAVGLASSVILPPGYDSAPRHRSYGRPGGPAPTGKSAGKNGVLVGPGAFARRWETEGGDYLHLVDLDAAFSGEHRNLESVRAIVRAVRIPCELGGGMRTRAAIENALEAGVTRVVIGTRAAESLDFVRDMAREFGRERIAVGIDARDGLVSIKGWTELSALRALDLARQAEDAGAGTIIYTDIATDGMLQGPNFPELEKVMEAVSCQVIASGGVSSQGDIERLRAIPGLYGCIIGKALYDGAVRLPEVAGRS